MREHFFKKGYETGIILIIITLLVMLIPATPNVMKVAGVWPSPGIVYKGDNGIALTFNVELGDDSVLWLLEELNKEGITKATFFLDPAWIDRQKDVVKEIKLAGYDIGIYDLHPTRYDTLEEKDIAKHLVDLRTFFSEHDLEAGYYRTKDELLPPSVIKIMAKHDFIVVGHQLNGKDLSAKKNNTLKGAVVELEVPNKLEDMKSSWKEWSSVLNDRGNNSYVTLLELLASSDSKIRLLD
ncbi:hypothetical protein E2R51_17735 [Jeotgalibacillus sp. S-D1]|uniref:polysaccharide deacetylase family protein n=1 Tax=Jeotgalibacillus sp. S-D1 TaxID=2552189 RepID=UPI00105A0192|nr:polysaccharide deacetylase family protein [Jeotgalibacillus sp. S-D1]TDL30513.1 hypothetical protein E2R51_17735 [Jeotgalibacillus sp. S-D1]